MENFWTILPLGIILSIVIRIYIKGKRGENGEVKKDSYLKPKKNRPYIELFFFARTKYRKPSTNILYTLSLWIIPFILFLSTYSYYDHPVVSLTDMDIVEGQVTTIYTYKKGMARISIQDKNGETIQLLNRIGKRTKDKILHQNVKIWHFDGFEKYTHIFQIYINDIPYTIYDYSSKKEENELYFKLILAALLIWIISISLLWIFNKNHLRALIKQSV